MSAAVPRQSLLWFFAAQVAVVAPHVPRLPWWLLAVWGVCALWRIQVYRGHWSWPGKLPKSLIVLVVLSGILAWYRNPMALESAAGTVIALFFLKLLECYQRRDVYLLTFVAAFVAALAFLFGQGLLLALWVLFALGLLLVSLVSLHDPLGRGGWAGSVKPALRLLWQALPLMLVLFLVFPRLAPMWSVPIPGGGSARTGMGDSLSPGDITLLGRSAELAFRVTFEGESPAKAQWYWRGLVLGHFDGRTWHPGHALPAHRDAAVQAPVPALPAAALRYEILLEPSGSPWLFALGRAYSNSEGVLARSDGTLLRRTPVTARFRYQATSLPLGQEALEGLERFAALRLPEGVNPQARAWAQQLHAQATDDAAFINAVLRHFREAGFSYTLQPPALGRHSVDDFLFGSRQGFCEHYASSMAFVLRAAGVPARVVVGYQGGEASPFESYLLVRQYDAHAWVEAWLDGQGWLRVDPTAAVAPERVQLGMAAAMQQDSAFMADSLAASLLRHSAWLGQARLWLDQADYHWQRWVLGYDSERQADTLLYLLGEISPARVSLLVMSVFGLALAGVLLSLWGRDWLQRRDPAAQAYARACRALARHGLPRHVGEAPGDYARRVAVALPAAAAGIRAVTTLYERLVYQPASASQRQAALRLLRTKSRAFVRESAAFHRSSQHEHTGADSA